MMMSRSSSITCKLTWLRAEEQEHCKRFPEPKSPGDLFSEPKLPPKDSETDAGAGYGAQMHRPQPHRAAVHDIRAGTIKVAHTLSLHLLGQIPAFLHLQ